MIAPPGIARKTLVRHLRRLGSPSRLAETVALVATGLVLDRVTRAAASLSPGDPDAPMLLAAAATRNPVAWSCLAAALAAAIAWSPARLRTGWHDVEHGAALRWLALAPLALLAWSSSLYRYNFLAGQWHVADRALVIVLAGAALYRPLALIPFVLMVRVVAGQFALPFGTESAQNIDAILVAALVVLAAVYAMHVVTGTTHSAPALLVLSTIIASRFFVPGLGKLALGWWGSNQLSNFPLSAYTAGWLAQTSGWWARAMSSLATTFDIPLRLGTLVVEVGAAVAVVHDRLFRGWLLLAVAFHATIFAFTGFWFLAWVALETSLLVVLSRRGLREWVAQNRAPELGLLAAAIVILAGGRLYQPPALTWLDGPVSYGYELEGTGSSGAEYHVPLGVAAPFAQDLSFLRLQLAATRHASAAYGALGTRAEFDALNAVESWEGLARYERALPPPAPADHATSERFLMAVLDHINRDGPGPWFVRPPPPHFWNGRPAPVYRYQEPLVRLDVIRVTGLHLDDGQRFRRERVLTLEGGPGLETRVTFRAQKLN
jgi:hypothetical protein